MRLFYDVDTTRPRAESWLILADIAALASAIVYATGAIHPSADPSTVLLLALWAAFPRAIAKVLSFLESPGKLRRALGASMLLVVLGIVLVVTGWDLLIEAAPSEARPDAGALFVIFSAWASGFLLFHARAYRLHDFLLLAVILFGLKAGRPLAALHLPVFFAALYLSSASRHALHDLDRRAREGRINCQNSRAVAAVAALFTLAALGASWGVATLGLEAAGARREAADREGAAVRFGTGRGGSGGAGARGASFPAEVVLDGSGGSVTGFSYRVELKDLGMARHDPREVLRVTAPDAPGWKPSPRTLWRAVSFSRFDPAREAWGEESGLEERAWPADGRLELRPPSRDGKRPLRLLHRVSTPVFRNLVGPYRTVAFETEAFAGVAVNGSGDLFPSPSLGKGTEYTALVEPVEADLPAGGAGLHPDPRYRDVPAATGSRDAGLRKLAGRIFAGVPPDAASRVRRLREHFERGGFRYSNQAVWFPGRSRLEAFLAETRIGDCTFYATASALVLRAGGVSTRLIVGFLGGTWDERKRAVIVRNHEAHAWVEAWVPGAGWFPIDPVAWVPVDPTYRPPPDLARQLGLRPPETGALEGDFREIQPPRFAQSAPPPDEHRPGLDYDLSDDRYHTDPVEDDGTRARRRSAAPEDGDWGSWIRYDEAPVSDEVGPGADLPPWSPDALGLDPEQLGAGSGTEVDARVVPERDGELRPPLSEVVRTALRIVMIPLAAAVLLLVVRAFLRPVPGAEDDEPEGEEDGDERPGRIGDVDRDLGGLDPRERILAHYLRLQAALHTTRRHRRPHQTPVEHGRRISSGRPELEDIFAQVHEVLYRLVYGDGVVTEADAAAVGRCCRKIARALT